MSKPLPRYPSDVLYAKHSMHPDWKRVKEWKKDIDRLPGCTLYQGIADLQRRVDELEQEKRDARR